MNEFSEDAFGKLIRRTLQTGIALSVLFFALGWAARLSGRGSSPALMKTGAFLLILTPVARVAMLIYGFLRTQEYPLALISAAVLTLLSLSLLL